MSFNPNAVPPSEPPLAPEEEGAGLGIPQPRPGETAAGAEEASYGDMTPEELAAENRRLQQRVGTLSEELRSRYEAPSSWQQPGYQGPQGYPAPGYGYGQPQAAPAPQPARPRLQVEVPDEALAPFEEYGIPRESMQSFAQAVGQSVHDRLMEQVVPYVQDTAVTIAQASELSRRFYAANEDLVPFRDDVRAVSLQFMNNPAQHRGRSFEQCAGEIANIVRLGRNLPVKTAPGQAPSAVPNEAASVEGAQTAPGGTAGGAAGTGRRNPAPQRRTNPADEYIGMRTNDHAARLLGGTRAGMAALAKTKVK